MKLAIKSTHREITNGMEFLLDFNAVMTMVNPLLTLILLKPLAIFKKNY